MDKKEKTLVVFMVILIFALLIKSILLDTYNPGNSEEQAFFDEVETILEMRETSWIYDYHIVSTRVVKLKVMTDKERTVKGPDGETYVATGIYKAKVRKYVFGIIPFSDKYILDINQNE